MAQMAENAIEKKMGMGGGGGMGGQQGGMGGGGMGQGGGQGGELLIYLCLHMLIDP